MNRRTVTVLAAVMAAAMLLSIGMALGSRRTQPTDPAPATSAATRESAAEAASHVVTTMLDGDTLAAPDLRSVMDELLTPDLLDQWETLAASAIEGVAEPLGGKLALAGRLAVIRTWALSTHIDHFDNDTATVVIWTMSIAESSMKPDAPRTLGWRTAVVDLEWNGDRWIAASVDFVGGPVPGGEPQIPTTPDSVVRAALGEPRH